MSKAFFHLILVFCIAYKKDWNMWINIYIYTIWYTHMVFKKSRKERVCRKNTWDFLFFYVKKSANIGKKSQVLVYVYIHICNTDVFQFFIFVKKNCTKKWMKKKTRKVYGLWYTCFFLPPEKIVKNETVSQKLHSSFSSS